MSDVLYKKVGNIYWYITYILHIYYLLFYIFYAAGVDLLRISICSMLLSHTTK